MTDKNTKHALQWMQFPRGHIPPSGIVGKSEKYPNKHIIYPYVIKILIITI